MEYDSAKVTSVERMIKYTVRCGNAHEFEGWFKDSASFDSQSAAGAVSCPRCGDTRVERAPMAPRISKTAGSSEARKLAEKYFEAAAAVRKEVEEKCDYVGDQFADEARKIHYGETEERGIYGEATLKDARDLDDEGIEVVPLPAVRRDS